LRLGRSECGVYRSITALGVLSGMVAAALLLVLEGSKTHIYGLSVQGGMVACCYGGSVVDLWSLSNGRKIRTLHYKRLKVEAGETLGGHCEHVAFSPDAKWVAAGNETPSDPGYAPVWRVSDGRSALKLKFYAGTAEEALAPSQIGFSRDGSRLFGVSWQDPPTLWDSSTGNTLKQYVNQRTTVWCNGPGSASFCFIDQQAKLRIAGDKLQAIDQRWAAAHVKLHATSIAFSGDGRALEAIDAGETGPAIEILNLTVTGVARRRAHMKVQSENWALDAERGVAFATHGRAVREVDSQGRLVRGFEPTKQMVNRICLAGKGRLLVGSSDGPPGKGPLINVWQVLTGRLVRTIRVAQGK
jgi:hypothetical protein